MDSTGIASRLDAEESRHLVGAYLDAASAAVTERSGFEGMGGAHAIAAVIEDAAGPTISAYRAELVGVVIKSALPKAWVDHNFYQAFQQPGGAGSPR